LTLTDHIDKKDLPELLNIIMDNLGYQSKQILFDALEQDFGIHVYGAGNISLDELEFAFIDLFGESATNLIMNLLYKEAEKRRNQRMYRQGHYLAGR
jgi:hypothetical protein